jgi:hypothetical protein
MAIGGNSVRLDAQPTVSQLIRMSRVCVVKFTDVITVDFRYFTRWYEI